MTTTIHAYIACAAIIGLALGFVLGAILGHATTHREDPDQ